jgi:hypothetical protein
MRWHPKREDIMEKVLFISFLLLLMLAIVQRFSWFAH